MLSIKKGISQFDGELPHSVEEIASLLQKCRKKKALADGFRLHAYICKIGLEGHESLGNFLVPMLVDIGKIEDAHNIFDKLSCQNQHSWNSLLTGYVRFGQPERALLLYDEMQGTPVRPTGHTFVTLLKACARLNDGNKGCKLYSDILKEGLGKNFFVGSALVHMYAKCGLLSKAQALFDELPSRDAIVWTSLISGYIKCGNDIETLASREKMHLEGIISIPLTYVCILKACARGSAVDKGRVMHTEIETTGLLEEDSLVGNALMDMYARCGSLGRAQDVFEKLIVRDVVSWNTLIAGYVMHGTIDEVFISFERMQIEGLSPDPVTLVCCLKVCSSILNVERGQELHVDIVQKGLLEIDPFIGNAVVDMYVNCGFIEEAEHVFNRLQSKEVVAWTTLIAGYVGHGHGEKALKNFEIMQREGVSPDVVIYICVLKACASIGAVDRGRGIHVEIDRSMFLDQHLNLGTALLDMYITCGLLKDAQKVFDKLTVRDVVSWNSLTAGYVKCGYSKLALDCFEQMHLEGVSPDYVTYMCILKCCGELGILDKGQIMHAEIVKEDLLENHINLHNALVYMYGTCGCLGEAQDIFDELSFQDSALWNTLITRYVKCGYFFDALICFEKMQQQGVSPDVITFASILKVCEGTEMPFKCHEINIEIVKKGILEKYVVHGFPLVESLPQHGLLVEMLLSETLLVENVLWNTLIGVFANLGCAEEALHTFKSMQRMGFSPDVVSLLNSLKACSTIGELHDGHKIHVDITVLGLENVVVIGTELLDMYATCGHIMEAQIVFDKILNRDAVCWNTIISGYIKEGYDKEALECLEQMELDGVNPDATTCLLGLHASANLGNVDKGNEIHSEIARRGYLEVDLVVNALVAMYISSGFLSKAKELVDMFPVDVVAWNTLIAGYANHAKGEEALECFEHMQLEGVFPDDVTFVCTLKACTIIEHIHKGLEIHSAIVKRGLLREECVVGNSLVDMYTKCNWLAEGRDVFNKLGDRYIVSWNALITGTVDQFCEEEALNYFEQMRQDGISPDIVTFICSMKACGRISALEKGRQLHSEILKMGLLESSVILGNALVDMYVDCGVLSEAKEILEDLPSRDVISWTSLIAGYTQHGYSKEALECLENMQQEGILSDVPLCNALITGYAYVGEIKKIFNILDKMATEGVEFVMDTFTSVLTACSHTGLVDNGQMYFESMTKEYDVIPNIEHYTCMLDLLGRAGQLEKAGILIEKMPFHPDLVSLHTLQGACRKWGNVVLGQQAFEYALRLNEMDAGAYVCMSNIYSDAYVQEADILRKNAISANVG